MPEIDPYLKAMLDAMAASGFSLQQPFEATALRALLDSPMPAPPVPGVTRQALSVMGAAGPLPARLYRPEGDADVPLPLILFFHGGGWVIGTLDTHERLAMALAAGVGAMVLSVAYRLAPEHPFPAAIDDCLAVARTIDPAEFGARPGGYAVAGDSAGGNLAAATALALAGSDRAPVHQLLYYPVIEADFDTASYRDAPDAGVLPPALMRWFWDSYAKPVDRTDPRVAPIHAASLDGVAPATIFVAGNDPLHDEGVAYADRLKAAGVAVDLHDEPGAIHGYASFFGIGVPVADAAVARGAAALKAAFAGNG